MDQVRAPSSLPRCDTSLDFAHAFFNGFRFQPRAAVEANASRANGFYHHLRRRNPAGHFADDIVEARAMRLRKGCIPQPFRINCRKCDRTSALLVRSQGTVANE